MPPQPHMKNDLCNLTPSQWVAHMRAQHGLTEDLPYQVPAEFLDDFLSHLPDTDREEAREVWGSRQGRPAHEIYDELMQTYTEQIGPILKPEEHRVFSDTYFAVLPTRKFNGYAGFTPRGDRVIVLHEALGFTLNYWSYWYLRLHEEGNGYLTNDPERLVAICKYIMRVWNGLPPGTCRPDIHPRTTDSWRLAETMTLSAISFVLGHELGHVLRGHTPYTDDRDANHAMEFEADQIGLSVTIRHSMIKSSSLKQDNYFTKFGLFAPLFAMAVMSLFGDTSSVTHPSATQRKDKLLASYWNVFRTVFTGTAQVFWDDIDESLQNVLEFNASRLFEIAEALRDIIRDIGDEMPAHDLSWLTTSAAFRKS